VSLPAPRGGRVAPQVHDETFICTFQPIAAGLLDDELHRARAHVVHGAGCGHGGLAHAGAQLGRHAGGGGFFQHLLVAALHRAVALEQVHAVAVRVAKHLDLDVAGALHVFLDQHRIVAKAVDGFALARVQRRGKVLGLVHRAHALATTTRAGLDEHGVANAVGLALQQRGVLVRTVVAGHQGHLGLLHQALGLGLEPHGVDGAGGWADEDQARVGTGLGEVFVLAQKAVAGVDGLRARGLGGVDDALPAQVAVLGRAAANVHGLVAHGHMLGIGVGVGIHGDGLHAQAAWPWLLHGRRSRRDWQSESF
jgi:hypothetical protein